MYGMGTYICMMPVFHSGACPAVMMSAGLNTEHHTAPGRYVSFVYNQGGSMVKWFRDTFAAGLSVAQAKAERAGYVRALTGRDSDRAEQRHGAAALGATGPPDFIDDSCGVMLGLKLETTRGEISEGLDRSDDVLSARMLWSRCPPLEL